MGLAHYVATTLLPVLTGLECIVLGPYSRRSGFAPSPGHYMAQSMEKVALCGIEDRNLCAATYCIAGTVVVAGAGGAEGSVGGREMLYT